MFCDNCGKQNANVRYTQIINGNKKEMTLCEDCSKKLGIAHMDFNMPIDFSSFFGDFLEEFENSSFISTLVPARELKCKDCGLSFEEFMHTGKFGCNSCYDAFDDNLDAILKNIQGSNRHVGRIGKITESNMKSNNKEKHNVKVNNKKEKTELEKLEEDLKLSIKEERYEDAAKIRDEIKNIKERN